MRTPRPWAAPLAVFAGLSMLVAGCAQPPRSMPTTGSHAVVDSTGASVMVPSSITRIADAWPAHNEVVQMLGGGDKIVATVLTPASVPWLYAIDPALHQARTVFTSSTANTEQLLTTHPDVLFTDKSTPIAALTAAGAVPTVQLGFQTYPELEKMVATTAAVLGPAAQVQGQAYNSYLDTALADVTRRTADIPVRERPTVLHIYSLHPLVVDGTDSIVDAWITAAGGRNAARVSGNVRPVSTEQVAQWNPDVIILASSAFAAADTGAQTVDGLRADPFWSRLPAVRDDKAVLNPTGGWHWDRYGVEGALQLRWAAKTLHPDRFTDLDMVAVTRDFYARFLHHPLSVEQARRMLAAQNPV